MAEDRRVQAARMAEMLEKYPALKLVHGGCPYSDDGKKLIAEALCLYAASSTN